MLDKLEGRSKATLVNHPKDKIKTEAIMMMARLHCTITLNNNQSFAAIKVTKKYVSKMCCLNWEDERLSLFTAIEISFNWSIKRNFE